MSRIDARVGKLEAQSNPGRKRLVVVFAKPGEDRTECIRRRGHDPDDPTIGQVIIVRWGLADEGQPG